MSIYTSIVEIESLTSPFLSPIRSKLRPFVFLQVKTVGEFIFTLQGALTRHHRPSPLSWSGSPLEPYFRLGDYKPVQGSSPPVEAFTPVIWRRTILTEGKLSFFETPYRPSVRRRGHFPLPIPFLVFQGVTRFSSLGIFYPRSTRKKSHKGVLYFRSRS